jgi:23S rRNA pseudouridine1911/1915/1917 synthase
VPKLETAIIDAPIARNPKKPQTFYVNKDGKAAQTEYKILKTINKGNRSYAVVELKPMTGRTHQLRIHMAYIGHPIVGDRVYGVAGDYLLLHAKQLELTLPNRQRLIFEAPLSEHIKEFIG